MLEPRNHSNQPLKDPEPLPSRTPDDTIEIIGLGPATVDRSGAKSTVSVVRAPTVSD
jgi:hypothetical protein